MKLHWTRTALPALLVTMLVTNAAQAQTYTMTLLGFAPFSNSISGANGINNNGFVVGFDAAINSGGYIAVRSWGPDLHSYLYTPGHLAWWIPRLTDLGTLGGTGGLNNTGQAVALGNE